ncbi:MAG: hypothetical protein ACE5I7_10735 [Candidatus Binatia bacterium]
MERKAAQAQRKWSRASSILLASVAVLLLAGTAWRAEADAVAAVTDENVSRRIVTAKTAADQSALATYYHAQAAAALRQVKRHEAMLQSYARVAGKSKEHMRRHCEALIQTYKRQQKQFEGLAQQHEKVAKALQSKGK